MDIDFLFIGGIIPSEIENEIIRKSKRNLQLAANNFQWSLIKGFDKNIGKPISILNTIFVGSYPKNYKDMVVRKTVFSHTAGARDYNLGFLNLTILKQIFPPFGEKKILKSWAKKNNSTKIAFIYSLSPRSVKLAKLIKKINPDIYVCNTVNDLPEFIMLSESGGDWIRRTYKKISKNIIEKGLKYIDGYMLVTEAMAQSLGITNKPYTVIEALIDTSKEELNNKIKHIDNKLKTVVYTGGLTKKYGLLNLLEAFMKIENKNYRLLICGDGETKQEILRAAETDKRIIYKGVLSPMEVKEIQRHATVLVNPRQNTGEYTKYSFPIKIAEYLLSGNPVICYKLDGVPNEYDDYLFYVNDNSIQSLYEKIIEVSSFSKAILAEAGHKNREFILNNKNYIVQTKKILDMIINN